ncbi:MAG: PilZ domain-containing protein [Spirochaetales bacterium]|nr:PilZ domain-containing protein [Spirochaetales bacterium]
MKAENALLRGAGKRVRHKPAGGAAPWFGFARRTRGTTGPPKDDVMGVQVNRIEKEFILSRLQQQGTVVSVHGDKKESPFMIDSLADESITLAQAEPGQNAFERKERIRVFFDFQNSYYTFDSQVLARTEKGLEVGNPKSIYRDPQRKYERIKLAGIKLFFMFEGDKVELDFPKTDTFTLVEAPEYSSSFNPSRIGDMTAAFRTSLQGRISDLTIVMYRDRTPATFEERLTVKLGKALWIPSTAEDLPLNDPGFSGNIIVKREVEDFLAVTGTPPYLVRSEATNLTAMKAKNGVTAELMCPILYHEYAVGYIHLVNTRPRTERFGRELLEEVVQFSRVLSYSLEINGYYLEHARGQIEHTAPVIDISASGLLFAAGGTELERKIDLFHDLRLHLEIEGRKLVLGTRIMRKFKDADSSYFAAQFMDVPERDFTFLYEFLYGKPFSEEAHKTWEGGSPPPPLAPPP